VDGKNSNRLARPGVRSLDSHLPAGSGIAGAPGTLAIYLPPKCTRCLLHVYGGRGSGGAGPDTYRSSLNGGGAALSGTETRCNIVSAFGGTINQFTPR